MKIKDKNGAVINITSAVPSVELRVKYNNRTRRAVEPAERGVTPNAIVFNSDTNCMSAFGSTPAIMVGNLSKECVDSILNKLLSEGYADLSTLEYQKKERFNAIEYAFDKGESGAYWISAFGVFQNNFSQTGMAMDIFATPQVEDESEDLSHFSDEELRQTIYDLKDTTMLELGQMSREELEEEYERLEGCSDE